MVVALIVVVGWACDVRWVEGKKGVGGVDPQHKRVTTMTERIWPALMVMKGEGLATAAAATVVVLVESSHHCTYSRRPEGWGKVVDVSFAVSNFSAFDDGEDTGELCEWLGGWKGCPKGTVTKYGNR